MNTDQQQDDQQGGAVELTEEQKKRLMVGQCNYMLLMTISLAAFICSQNSTWTCFFADRQVKFAEGFDVNAACARDAWDDLAQQTCRSFLDNQ